MAKLDPDSLSIENVTTDMLHVSWTLKPQVVNLSLTYNVTAGNAAQPHLVTCNQVEGSLKAECSNLIPGLWYAVTVVVVFGDSEGQKNKRQITSKFELP